MQSSDAHIVDSLPLHDGGDANASAAATTTVHRQRSGGPDVPRPMTLPAILRQNVPGYKSRIKAVQTAGTSGSRLAPLKAGGGEGGGRGSSASPGKLGKRKQRRWENANFHGSAYVTRPRASDYSPCNLSSSPTFPSPPPSTFYPYRSSAPQTSTSADAHVFDDSRAADFGRFSLPLKGLKKATRRIVESGGGPGEEVVRVVDAHLRHWLGGAAVFLNPDAPGGLPTDERCILDLEDDASASAPQSEYTIAQISRQPHNLIWAIQDPFIRFLVHAVARYYRVVSFTKTVPAPEAAAPPRRLVYLLRPNMPSRTVDPFSRAGLETPPTTEWEASSTADTTGSERGETETETEAETDADADADADKGLDTASETASLLELSEGEEDDENEQAGDATLQAITPEGPDERVPQEQTRGRRRHSPTFPAPALSDIDSGAEVEVDLSDTDHDNDDDDTDSVHSAGIESLSNSVSSLAVEPPSQPSQRTSLQHPSARNLLLPPLRHAAYRDDSISRDASPTAPLSRHPGLNRTGDADVHGAEAGIAGVSGRLIQPSLRTINNAKSKESKGWRMPELTFAEWVAAS